jgi:hypothetical protein
MDGAPPASRGARNVRLLKLLLGIALLPAAFAITGTLVDLLTSLPSSHGGIPADFWWVGGGFVFWLVLWFALPRPARTYVLAHELTHAIWGLAWGARVSKLRVRGDGGSVNLSKTNVWITLAPYFFPLYTMIVIAVHIVVRLFFPSTAYYEPFWLALIGLTWGFHVTFTMAVLLQRQPDVQEHGRIFSWTLIYLLNIAGLIVGILAVTRGGWFRCIGSFGDHLLAAYGAAFHWFTSGLAAISHRN